VERRPAVVVAWTAPSARPRPACWTVCSSVRTGRDLGPDPGPIWSHRWSQRVLPCKPSGILGRSSTACPRRSEAQGRPSTWAFAEAVFTLQARGRRFDPYCAHQEVFTLHQTPCSHLGLTFAVVALMVAAASPFGPGLFLRGWLSAVCVHADAHWLGGGSAVPGRCGRVAGCGCYGGLAASMARVWRRRLRVLAGRPSAVLRAASAWRASKAARMRWLRTASRQASHSASGVRPVRRHQPRLMSLLAVSLMVAKVRSAPVRRA